MYQSIVYKEWIKTGKLVILASVLFLSAIAYSFISTAQILRLNGAVDVWETIIMKDLPLLSTLKWLPLLAAILLALAQYIPEMQNKRLKLTLHLPLPEIFVVTTMLGFGIVVLLSIFTITYAVLLTGLRIWFAPEIVLLSFYASLPWFVAGLAAYLLTAWICLEPVWRRRIVYVVFAIGCLSLFFIGARSGGYNSFIPYLIVVTVLGALFPFYSVARFKEGAQ
ncbi:MAG: hypothetical protein QM786_12180 [Breznakibacter sp.]